MRRSLFKGGRGPSTPAAAHFANWVALSEVETIML